MSGAQAQPCDNTLPFELEILPQKLKKASTPWATHFIGKGKAMLDSVTALPLSFVLAHATRIAVCIPAAFALKYAHATLMTLHVHRPPWIPDNRPPAY